MPVALEDEKGTGLNTNEEEDDDTDFIPIEDVVKERPEDFEDFSPRGIVDEADEGDKVFELKAKREDTRGRLAIIYTLATFLMFLLGFLVSVIDASWRQVSIIDNLSTVLPLISGIFLGSLGFVLGYYFRKVEGENGSS